MTQATTPLTFDVITLFPEMFDLSQYGIVGRAIRQGDVVVRTWNPRDFNDLENRQIDDKPFGGEAGMVMRAEPLKRTLDHIKQAHGTPQSLVVAFAANVKPLSHAALKNLPSHIILICGRYQGIDQRFLQHEVDCLWSIGDYTLSGGELPALVVIDTLARQVKGVLGNQHSLDSEAETSGLCAAPLYTRPAMWRGHAVPEVLLNGHHQQIEKWRRQAQLEQTEKNRPEWLDE